MRHLKFFETKNTPQEILDLFDDKIKSYDLDDKFKLSVDRTKSSFKVIIVDKVNNKTIGRIYIQDIRNREGKFTAELRRLYINDEYRGLGLGDKLLSTAIDTFSDIELYGYASPNRNKGMKDNEKEGYRKRLFNFYDRHGLKRVSDKNFKIVRHLKEYKSFTTPEEERINIILDRGLDNMSQDDLEILKNQGKSKQKDKFVGDNMEFNLDKTDDYGDEVKVTGTLIYNSEEYYGWFTLPKGDEQGKNTWDFFQGSMEFDPNPDDLYDLDSMIQEIEFEYLD